MIAWMLWIWLGLAVMPTVGRGADVPLGPLEDHEVRAKLFGPIEYGAGELSEARSCGMDPTPWVFWLDGKRRERVLVAQRRRLCGEPEAAVRLEVYDVSGARAWLISASAIYNDVGHVAFWRELEGGCSVFEQRCLGAVAVFSVRTDSINYEKVELIGFDGSYGFTNVHMSGCWSKSLVEDVSSYILYSVNVADDAEYAEYMVLLFELDDMGLVKVRRLFRRHLASRLSITDEDADQTTCAVGFNTLRCEREVAAWLWDAIRSGLGRFVWEPWLLEGHGVLGAEQLALLMHQRGILWAPYRVPLFVWSAWMWSQRRGEQWSDALLWLAADLLLGRAPGRSRAERGVALP